MTREGLEDTSSNLGWGKRYFIFSAQRPQRLWGFPSLIFAEYRSERAGERSLQHIPVPSLRMSSAIQLPHICFHVVGKGKSLHFLPPKNIADIRVLLNLTPSRFYFCLALRCHVLTYCTFSSRFTEVGTPVF